MTLKELSQYLRGLPKTVHEAAVKGIKRGCQQAVPVLQRAGDRAPPASSNGEVGVFDTGKYRRSWKVMSLPDGAKLYNAAPYADVVERGRKKNRKQPPKKVIEAWARRKLGLSVEEARAAAYPIARAIGKRGLRARHVEKSARPQVTKIVVKEMMAEVKRALQRGGR
jgi:hypothetical protein